MNYAVRKARESDRMNIARTLAYSFEKALSLLSKDSERIVKIFGNGIDIRRFFVAEQGDAIIGAAACADCTGRAISASKSDCTKHLGAIRGRIVFRIVRSELMRPLIYPATTGYIDVVGVLAQERGKGVAKEILRELIKNNSQYNEFILDADSTNIQALKCYSAFGFVEFKRAPLFMFSKRARVFMRYKV
ncbi:MAG: GNAT family N-acetyltransferase [Dehalococcoidia bacterium]|nr:GNAT family N-acetyltransferase [Dehalococcoidia bacterium]